MSGFIFNGIILVLPGFLVFGVSPSMASGSQDTKTPGPPRDPGARWLQVFWNSSFRAGIGNHA